MTICCPSCQHEVDQALHPDCPSCGWAFSSSPQMTAIRPAGRPKIQMEVELACTVDRTGSSKRFAEGIRKSVPLILDSVQAKARWVKVWMRTHGDEDCGQQSVLLTDGGTPSQAIQDLGSIVFEGGGDPPEHHLSGIEDLLDQTPWKGDPQHARGALIAFLTADTKPARSGKTPRQLGEEIRNRGILFYLVCEPYPQLDELCQAAGGLLFRITNDPQPADLQKIAGQIAASVVYAAATGGTLPMTVAGV